jgi:hypothetical protein
MTGIHMLIGAGEAIITVLILAAIAGTRKELLQEEVDQSMRPAYTGILVYGLLIAVGVAFFAAPLASSSPDGLEKVAEDTGFIGKAMEKPLIPSPFPGYAIPGVESPATATALAGALGTIIMFAFAFVLARVVMPRQTIDTGSRTG